MEAHPRARRDHPQRASRSRADAHPARLRAGQPRPGRGLPPVRRGARRHRRLLAPAPDLLAAPGRRGREFSRRPVTPEGRPLSGRRAARRLRDADAGAPQPDRPEPRAPGGAARERARGRGSRRARRHAAARHQALRREVRPARRHARRLDGPGRRRRRSGSAASAGKTRSRQAGAGRARRIRPEQRVRRQPRPRRPPSGTACRSSSRPPCRSPPAGCGPAPCPWRRARSPAPPSAS